MGGFGPRSRHMIFVGVAYNVPVWLNWRDMMSTALSPLWWARIQWLTPRKSGPVFRIVIRWIPHDLHLKSAEEPVGIGTLVQLTTNLGQQPSAISCFQNMGIYLDMTFQRSNQDIILLFPDIFSVSLSPFTTINEVADKKHQIHWTLLKEVSVFTLLMHHNSPEEYTHPVEIIWRASWRSASLTLIVMIMVGYQAGLMLL